MELIELNVEGGTVDFPLNLLFPSSDVGCLMDDSGGVGRSGVMSSGVLTTAVRLLQDGNLGFVPPAPVRPIETITRS